MRLFPPPRPPLDAALAEQIDASFREEIQGLPLGEAVLRLQARLGGMLAGSLGTAPIACDAGCAACCHQPLLVSFLELGVVFFSDEARFGSKAFRASLKAPIARLATWKAAAGREGPAGVAARQFAAKAPCVLLGSDGRCTAYDARPFACRNAVSDVRCTFDALETTGYPDLAALGRRLRHRLVETYGLSRFDHGGVRVATAAFYLPEGLAWFADQAPRDALRALFRVG